MASFLSWAERRILFDFDASQQRGLLQVVEFPLEADSVHHFLRNSAAAVAGSVSPSAALLV
jgi:hypothetical protein